MSTYRFEILNQMVEILTELFLISIEMLEIHNKTLEILSELLKIDQNDRDFERIFERNVSDLD